MVQKAIIQNINKNMDIFYYIQETFGVTLLLNQIKNAKSHLNKVKSDTNKFGNSFVVVKNKLLQINHSISDGYNNLTTVEDLPEGRILLLNKEAISKAADGETLQVDCTYKLLHNKFPVLVVGINDFSAKLYPIGMEF